jgi:sulfur-oxidizing protein SoxZ
MQGVPNVGPAAPKVGEARILVPAASAPGEVVFVRALVSHPMDTGFFRTAAGDPIPAYFIRDVVVTYGEERVAHFTWTSGISRDPFVTFPLRVTRDAPLTITWTDNRGGVYTQSVPVTLSA